MFFTWPDPISLVADAVTIVGVPILWFTFRGWFKEWKYEREHNTVSMGCMEFNNVDDRCGVNLVPLEDINAVPRIGDQVYLPGETHDRKHYGTGLYEVLNVVFCYGEAPEINQACPARPVKIIVDVRKIE
ncbi:MAG: hypothetical protein JST61_11850 [Acidobacteria bacterium]|nr:hypothetical protein [Acidobacteriota bacterium]